MDKAIAMYLRLSREDSGNNDESGSISSQRSIIKSYISAAPELSSLPIYEFADDGYSGTSFSRPAVKKLLEAAFGGEICCIMVKDFSRFGRSYLEVSKYIEIIFPYLNIRFISVNDRYDSSHNKGRSADIDIVFRNLMNALYSKDISKKVKTAKMVKIHQGKNISAFAPYGYKKSAEDRYRMEIDKPAAEIVSRIFEMYTNGCMPAQIARALNAEGIVTPAEYKRLNGSNLKTIIAAKPIWSSGIVNNILNNEQYLGTLICGKTMVRELGGKTVVYKQKKEWLKIPDLHPAIITEETWETVGLIKAQTSGGSQGKPNTKRLLYKKIRCGYCGHIMRYRSATGKMNEGKRGYYYCETARFTGECGCKSNKYIQQFAVERINIVVKAQIALLINIKEFCVKAETSVKKSTETANKRIKQIDAEIERLEASKLRTYELLKLGRIGFEKYMSRREETEARISSKRNMREALISEIERMSRNIDKTRRLFSSINELKADFYSPERLAEELVETVYVFGRNRIEIKFKFRDELERCLL